MLYLLIICGIIITGCQQSNEEVTAVENNEEKVADLSIEKYTGDSVKVYDVIYTLDEVMTLVIEGITILEEVEPLLNQLDEYQIPATFFVTNEEMNIYPEAVEEVIHRGHKIENNAFYKMDRKSLAEEEIYYLLEENNEQIEADTGEKPEYVFSNTSKKEKEIRKTAAQLDMNGVIRPSYSIHDTKIEDEKKIKQKMYRAVARGSVLSLKPKSAEVIPYLADAMDEVDFTFIPLNEFIALDEERKPFKEIKGAKKIKKNLDIEGVEPIVHEREMTDEKEVALTFDDWAREAVVLEVLDILDEYDIQSTFYLKTGIVEENPNLARLLIERGHEVANHSHSHLDSVTLSHEELQEDLYQAHKIITEAIQEQPTLYFRPPFGSIDNQSAQAIAAMGFDAIGDYDVSSYDWNDDYSREDVINRVMTRVQPGSVIVMHILNDIHTPDVLPDLIEALQDDGYEFVLTSDWLEKN